MIGEVIRGFIGFDGLLMSDDVSMGALSGSLARAHAAPRSRPAATWSLHCNGQLDEMQAVAAEAPALAGEAARRADAALAQPRKPAAVRSRRRRAREFAAHDGAACSGRHGMTRRRPMSVRSRRPADRATDEPALVVDVEGFEGPLDLLLTLARQQKVDLAKISILALANQYLAFIEAARKLRLELAADYLVMAAWLAYLKSRLLLPEAPAPEGPSAEDMATALALRLRRLEAFRERRRPADRRAPQLGRDMFDRGDPEPIADIKQPQWSATLYDLLSAYARAAPEAGARACALQPAHGLVAGRGARRAGAAGRQARRLEPARRVPDRLSWSSRRCARPRWRRALPRRSNSCAKAQIELHQHAAFAPIYLRKRDAAATRRPVRRGRAARDR